MTVDINWYQVQSEAFTLIRWQFPVSTLDKLAAEDNETPVSGNMLAYAKAGIR